MAAEHPKFCPHCGTAVVGTMKFCTSCGKAVIADMQQSAPVSAPPVKKKSPAWAYVLITLLFLWGGWQFLVAPGMRVANRGAYSVTYRVSGTTPSAGLTLQNASGGTEQKDVSLPWESSFKASDGQCVYISAQKSTEMGTIHCEILLNGSVVKSAEANAAYGIASCSGRI
jgi:hypothetical protein